MKIQIVGKNVDITEAMRNVFEDKLKRMEKYFVLNEDVNCKVLVSTHKASQKIEITIFTKMMDFRVEVRDDDAYAGMDLAIDKLEGQMRKLKTRLNRRHKESLGKAIAFENFEQEDTPSTEDEIVRVKEIELEPMSLEEAITRMEAVGHTFYLYLDEEDEVPSVLYRRTSGGYGIIQARR